MFLLLSLLLLTNMAKAQETDSAQLTQETDSVQLAEINVVAARVVDKPYGKYIIPSKEQSKSSPNGYSLLSKLGLPAIRVDEVARTITALGNQGETQVRINGRIASANEILTLDPKTVAGIEFMDTPGIRYGKDVAYVINIKTRRADTGYSLGVDATNAATTRFGNNSAFAKINHKKSQWAVSYNFGYRDMKGSRYEEVADYLLTDNTTYTIARKDTETRNRDYQNNVEMSYSVADSARYLFQAVASTDMSNAPGSYQHRDVTEQGATTHTLLSDTRKSLAPSLDLYLLYQLGSHQTLTANVVGTHIASQEKDYNDEGGAYQYDTNGKTWSLISEAIYENQLRHLTLSLGLRHTMKYTDNVYRGDVESHNKMRNSGLYLFGELQGKWKLWSYTAGLGVNNERYRQGAYNYDFWLARPKVSVGYTMAPFSFKYGFEISRHISKIAMISDTQIRQNSMEWKVGNPDLAPAKVSRHRLDIDFTRPRLSAKTTFVYQQNSNCNLASYSRSADNVFYYTQKNQKGIDLIYGQASALYDAIPGKLSLSAYGGIYRYINRGDDYTHCLTAYDMGGSVQTYWGKWTFTANFDNGWKFMEGETWNKAGSALYFTASYRTGNCTLSVFWQNPLQDSVKTNEAGLVNRMIHKSMAMHNKDTANMITLNVSWRINRGRKYKSVQKSLQNKDTQTGIM